MLTAEHDGCAAHAARQFQERDHRTRKCHRADEGADEKLQLITSGDGFARSLDDAERERVVDRRNCNQHRRQTHQRVHECNQLRHRSHLHFTRDHCTDGTTQRDAAEDDGPVFSQR